MEAKKKFPSLPSNYVTLQQLQERRLKEQEQRQKEKEEEEQRRKLLEEQTLKEEQEEEERKLQKTQRAQAIEANVSGRSNRGNPRNFSERKRWIGKEIGSEVQKEGGGGGSVAVGIATGRGVSDEGQKPEESKRKKKKHWGKKSEKKIMTQKTQEESEAGVLKQSQAENGQKGNQIPVVPKEENKKGKRKGKKKKMEPKVKEEETPNVIVEEKEPENGHEERNIVDCVEKPVRVQGIRRRIRQGSKTARSSAVKKDSENITVTVVEIARELEDLAVADHHEQKEENHRGSMALRAGSGSYCRGPKLRRGQRFDRGRKAGDGALMWIKKGETSDGNWIQKANPEMLS